MARQTRQKKGAASPRSTAQAGKSAMPAKSSLPRSRGAVKAAVSPKKSPVQAGRSKSAKLKLGTVKGARPAPPTAGARSTPVAPPPAPPKKPGYYEALSMYESGVRALQRHDYQGAATQFRAIIERYPEERELQERSLLYLRVCERETAKRPATPQTAQERVYAATVALNAGDTAAALDHLRRALVDSPDSDHAHYIMSVALASKGDSGQALEHLRQAISLNPENRALARQDPDLEPVRGIVEFREILDGSPGSIRSKARKKR
jgi:tetratricopeptide (TPR) repeat protein